MTIAKPTQVATPFANSGLKNTIPQSATGSNLASLEEGFPAVTMTAVGDGGTPPQGQDFNGVLYQVTNQLRYAQAGGLYPYNSTFCTAIGGYPLGAILMSSDGKKIWQNQVAGNTNNPDSNNTNWTELCTVSALTAYVPLSGTEALTGGISGNGQLNFLTFGNLKNGIYGGFAQFYSYDHPTQPGMVQFGAKNANNGNVWFAINGVDETVKFNGLLMERVIEQSFSYNSSNYESTGYIRYDSGIQICFFNRHPSSSSPVTVTFPKAFLRAPVVATGTNSSTAGCSIGSLGSTSCVVQTTTSSALDVRCVAIGVWK